MGTSLEHFLRLLRLNKVPLCYFLLHSLLDRYPIGLSLAVRGVAQVKEIANFLKRKKISPEIRVQLGDTSTTFFTVLRSNKIGA
jgi:hypothetical protein